MLCLCSALAKRDKPSYGATSIQPTETLQQKRTTRVIIGRARLLLEAQSVVSTTTRE